MRVIIFYASYGGGHLSAANSIKLYLEEHYKNYNVIMIDCMKYINLGIEKITTNSYNLMAKKAPWAWGTIYKYSEKGPVAHICNITNKLFSIKLYKLFEEYQPDVVISTHPFSSQMVAILKSEGKTNCKLATILTDFASNDQWLAYNEYVDYFFVSHEGMRQELISKNIPGNKVFATGIPLSNRFLKHFDRKKIKESFDLDLNKKTILFFGGGEFGLGKEQTVRILKAFIDNIGDSYQIIVISGKNTKIQEKFEKLVQETNSSSKVQVYGYTNEVPELMSISDLVVTKPGGLTTTESLASGLPIVAINPIPGQEVENAQYLESQGIAVWIRPKEDPNETIQELLSNEQELKHMKIRSKLAAKKNSTRDICSIIFCNAN